MAIEKINIKLKFKSWKKNNLLTINVIQKSFRIFLRRQQIRCQRLLEVFKKEQKKFGKGNK